MIFFVETEQKEEDSEYLAELCSDLADRYKEEQLDAYLLYLYVSSISLVSCNNQIGVVF